MKGDILVITEYSKETLELLLDIIPDYIFYTDLDGRIIYCNERYAKKIIKKPRKEVYGKTHEELNLFNESSNIEKTRNNEVIDEKKSLKYTQIVYLNEVKYTIAIEKYPTFDKQGNVSGILNKIRNISHEDEISNLRDGFFSNIKHEFRTPINMIITSIQLLDNRCKICDLGNCKDCFIKDIHRINLNALRILKISNNFIDLTNLQCGNIDYNPNNYDIVDVVESLCNDINNYKKFKNITIIFDTEIEELIIGFDKIKLERILLNLISNAIKYNHENGNVNVNISLDEKFVIISVKDTGVGIKEEDLNNIFNEFYNVEDRFTKVCEGLGIGLKLTKYLVEIHNGQISVKSKIGNGSEFVVKIPNNICKYEYNNELLNRVYDNRLDRIKMELSDIYE